MKFVSFFLALCMLLSLAACSTAPVEPVESDEATDSTTPEETTTADTMEVQTGEAYYTAADYLPAETFDGEDIHLWIDSRELYYDIPEDRLVEGDVVHEAVMERNAAVAEALDVVLNWNRDWDIFWRDQAALRQSILAGDEYDIISGVSLYQNPQLVYGCYLDLAQQENIDLTQPWWLQEATNNMKIYDKQYTAVGYYDFPTITRISVYYFNDTMTIDYRFGNLYDMVENGEWTWDKMVEMSEKVSEDVNQDGVYDGSDKYGLSTRWDSFCTELSTAGYQYITRDAEGEYVITGITDDLLEMSDKIYPFITGSPMHFSRYTYGVHPSFPGSLDTEAKSMFTNDQILFMMENLSWASSTQLRDFGAYGILPPPKYTAAQENYGTASTPYICAICSTTGDARISSVVLEALQIESYNILRPAYITDALSYKYLSDPQAVSMLNLIFTNVTTDWSYNFASAGLTATLCRALPTEQYLASFFRKNSAAIEQKLEDFLFSVDAMP